MRLIESLFSVNTASEQQRRANFKMHDKSLVTLPFPLLDELQRWKFRKPFWV